MELNLFVTIQDEMVCLISISKTKVALVQ